MDAVAPPAPQRIAGRGEAPRRGARRRFAPLGPGNPLRDRLLSLIGPDVLLDRITGRP